MTARVAQLSLLPVVGIISACVDLDFEPIGRDLPCAVPTPNGSPEDAVVIVRAPVKNTWITVCSGVAITPRLVATQLKCVLGRSKPARTQIEMAPAPTSTPASFDARSGSTDLEANCRRDAGWTLAEDGDFSGRLGDPLDPSVISVSKTWTAVDTPGIGVTNVFAMPAQSLCRDDFVLLELERGLDVPLVAIRFGEAPVQGQGLVLSGFCNDTETSLLERREFSVQVEAATDSTSTDQGPPRAILTSSTVAAYSAGGAAITADSGAIVGLIMSGILVPDCQPVVEDGTTLVMALAPYRRMLLDVAEKTGETLHAELQPEIGVQLCPGP
jgi:hypothetical protein